MSTTQPDSSKANALAYLKENFSLYVSAALTYRDMHAQNRSMEEELCRYGFEAVYKEKLSSRDSILC